MSKADIKQLEEMEEQHGMEKKGPREVVSSGILMLDRALRIGGLPRACIVDVFGDETLGKTTLALTMMAERIRNGEMCAYVDVEHKLNDELIDIIIPDRKLFRWTRSKDGDSALALLEGYAKSSVIKMIVIDSMAAIVPSEMLEDDANPNRPGLAANRITTAIKRILTPIDANNQILVMINQMRANMSFFARGTGKVPTSINALKFHAHIRIQLHSQGLIRENNVAVGQKIGLGIIKNSWGAPFGEAVMTIRYGQGVDKTRDLLDCGVELGVIQKAGGWFAYTDDSPKDGPIDIKAHGEVELMEKLTPIMPQVTAKIIATMQAVKENSNGAIPAGTGSHEEGEKVA